MRNSELHHLENSVSFSTCNLFDVTADWLTTAGAFDRVLLDPPREGAQALCQAMADLHQADPSAAACVLPRRMVYVSCNPSTLARDAAILVHQGGWVLQQAGVINMFPHTAHVESIAMFERPK
jgi:23S rRNA (uracil1939-C5)-methyltransferase